MAPKKKTKKKPTKTKKSTAQKSKPTKISKKKIAKKKLAPKKPTTRKPAQKKAAQKKAAPKKTVVKPATAGKKVIRAMPASRPKKRNRSSRRVEDSFALPQESRTASSGGQSGDLQGLSSRESANSESVDELLEEGNAFEADAVMGVESAGDADESEVHTHEVPEDDVPEEYLDKD